MSKFVVGLRGGIGTGKSTVSELFADAGIVVADADISARTVVEPGKPAYEAIVERFGESVVQKDGTLDRPVLRELVFSDNDHRLFVEKQTHSSIVEDLLNITSSADSDYAILVLSTGIGKKPHDGSTAGCRRSLGRPNQSCHAERQTIRRNKWQRSCAHNLIARPE